MNKKIFKKYRGMTLIEMMMAIAIFSIGIAGFTMLFSRTWKYNSDIIIIGQSSMSASQGLNKIVDYIRRAKQGDDGAYAIISANNFDLVIFCDYDKDGAITERLHFYKSGQNILMGITAPTDTLPKTYPAGDQQTITIVSNVVNGADKPVFSYFNKDYPADMVSNPEPVPAAVADVRLVKVYLEVNVNPNKYPNNTQMQSFAEMRNLNDYNQI